jgi:hypothetical protein
VSYIGNSALPFNPLATSGKPRDAQRFNGDNTTTTFTLNFRVDNATDLEVFVDNVQQEPLTAYDALANQLIFTEAPPSGTNNIYVVYRNTDSGIFANIPDGSITFNKLANNIRLFTTDNFTGDGGTATFTLSSDVPDANTLVVAVDGVFQRAPIHYTASNNTITFSSAPPVSSNVHVRHLGFRTTQTVTALPANTTITQPTLESPNYTGTLTGGTGVIDIGSGQLFKDASGNFGIGTSTPSDKLQVAGGLTLGGQLNLGSNGQIVFPATQNASANANTLDDYEEGTWTPNLISIGGTNPTGVTFSVQLGRYTKIGNMVFISGAATLSNKGTGGSSGVGISGLPFATANIANFFTAFGMECDSLGSDRRQVNAVTLINSTAFAVNGSSGSTGSAVAIPYSEITNTTVFRFGFFYRVN